MSRPSLRVLILLLAACSARTSELLTMVVMMLVGVADSRLARQLLMSSPRRYRANPHAPRHSVRSWSAAVLCRFGFCASRGGRVERHPVGANTPLALP